MPVVSRRHASQARLISSAAVCPCCQGKLVRERRRVVDRLRSLFRPVRRYRCENFACQWTGTLANPVAGSSGSGGVAGAPSAVDEDQRTRGIPASFVVHMVLVAVGVVFVLVYSTMEPAVSFDETEPALGLAVQE